MQKGQLVTFFGWRNSSQVIIPLSQGEAFEFAQQHATPEQAEAYFPHLIED